MPETVFTEQSLTVTINYDKYFEMKVPEDIAADLLSRLIIVLVESDAAPLAVGASSDVREFYLTYKDGEQAAQVSDALRKVRYLLDREERRGQLFREVTGKFPRKQK